MIPTGKVYLVSGSTDMRKPIDGLSYIVADILDMVPFNEPWFIVCNRHRDKLKVLSKYANTERLPFFLIKLQY